MSLPEGNVVVITPNLRVRIASNCGEMRVAPARCNEGDRVRLFMFIEELVDAIHLMTNMLIVVAVLAMSIAFIVWRGLRDEQHRRLKDEDAPNAGPGPAGS